MLKNNKILFAITLSVFIAAIDFFILLKYSGKMFYIHNLFALIVGGYIVYYSYILIKKKVVHKKLFHYTFIIGFAMVIIHITKILIGKCL